MSSYGTDTLTSSLSEMESAGCSVAGGDIVGGGTAAGCCSSVASPCLDRKLPTSNRKKDGLFGLDLEDFDVAGLST